MKDGEKQPRHKDVPELKINSRAALWASSDAAASAGNSNSHDQRRGAGWGPRNARGPQPDAWAAARGAGRPRRGRDRPVPGEGSPDAANVDAGGISRSMEAVKLVDRVVNPGERTEKQLPQGQKIRKEWEKIDSNYAKSSMEGGMELLLQHMNCAEVGELSKKSANLPRELADGEGGTAALTQEQTLADAAGTMMGRWHDHGKWRINEARLAGQILLRMEIEETTGGGVQVPKRAYLSVINAYAKVTDEDETASIRAENILDHMEKRAEEGRSDLKPDRLVINTVMGAQAKHALSGTLTLSNIRASERLLDVLEREYAAGDKTMQPTSRTYSKFIDLYAKHGRAEDAASALQRMEAQYRNGNRAAVPRTIHFTSVIDAFAKSSGSNVAAAKTSEEILRSMLDMYDGGDRYVEPDTAVFGAVIDAYAKSKRRDAAERALGILDLMDKYGVAPDIVNYNIVLNTLSRSPNYSSKAKELLQMIEQSDYLRADSFTYNSAIKSFSPEDAEGLIKHWEMEYVRGRTDERPDSYTYTALIKSWTISNIVGFEDKCIEILQWMETQGVVGLNRIAYNEVMKAVSRSNRDDAGALTERVFNQLVARYEQTRDRELRPDRFSFMALLNAYTRNCSSHNDAAKAENVLFEMMNSNHLPDSKLCNNVISAWARSGSSEAVTRVEEICDRMDSLGIEIDGVVFNSLVNVHAKSQDRNKSVNALRILDRMKERSVEPSSVTYTLLCQACVDDEEYLLQVFESCIKHGMLDEKLQAYFRTHGPAAIRDQLEDKIPFVWTQYANRGPGGPSRGQIKGLMKKGSTGADVRRFGWAR